MEFISAQYYISIYLIFVLLLTIIYLPKYNTAKYTINIDNRNDKTTGIIIVTIISLFIGTRPISEIFSDMPAYLALYQRHESSFSFEWSDNFIWDNLCKWFAYIRLNPLCFYIIISFFYFTSIFYACSRLFLKDKLIVFIVYLAAFSTFAYATNGLKAGTAAVMFLVALSYRNKRFICAILLVITLGFHHSMQLPIIAFLITIFYRKPKFYFLFWFFCLLMAIAHVTYFQNLFAGYTDEHGAAYLTGNGSNYGDGGVGFRPDFILYSAMPVWVGWYATFKKQIKSKMYESLLCTYLLTNGVWMLCMYAEFTNRIAYLSWLMYPIVLVYPLLNENWKGEKYKTFYKIACYHIAFTLFMQFIYYPLIK